MFARSTHSEVDVTRKISLVAGLFFLLTFVHVAILFLYEDILTNPNFILGDGDVTPVRLGAVADIVTGLAGIATGVIFYQVLRRQNRAVALGYVAMRTFEAVMICVGTICLLAIVTLREDFAGTSGTDATQLSAIGSALVAVRDWTFFFGPGLCSLGNGLLLGFLMFRSGLVPRNLALFGVIGGPVALVGITFVLFGQWEQADPQQFFFTLSEIIWEFGLSIYLIVKGFRRSAITADMKSEAGQVAMSAKVSATSAA
jgi:hypothetical protein